MKHITLLTLLALFIVSCKKDTSPEKPATVVDYHQTAVTQFIETAGTKYAYRVLGDKPGTPLILLSPLSGSMDDWDPAITNGLARQYKVILFDNKGVGESNGKTPNNIADMANDAVGFIKALGYSKVNLLGFSMGGFITQQIVLTQPQLVNKIILTGTGPKGSEGLADVGKIFASGSGLSPTESFLKFLFAPSTTSKAAGQLSYDRIHKRTVNRDAATTGESGGAQLTAVLGWAQPNSNAFNELKTIAQPALIVEGQDDLLVPVVNSFNMYRNMPNAQLSLYPDAGHGSIFQYPDLFLHTVTDFLNN
jgi:pimeloyl-ACP methyl ester carboxylesterase